jgi:uncharacterized protein YecE (DUF72 family)
VSIIGTAGWTIPAQYKDQFTREGSHLERYASRLRGVEISSSFYRPHKRATYSRWAATVPDTFRFSIKVPRAITQTHRLKDYGRLLEQFLDEVSGLGHKLGVLLAQLPPSLPYDAEVAEIFFRDLGKLGVTIACEPRHASWFTPAADKDLKAFHVARVAADPPRAPNDGIPGGETQVAYFRLHGSPKIYYSDYSEAALCELASKLGERDWCIFDNTAGFHALGNALSLESKMMSHRSSSV